MYVICEHTVMKIYHCYTIHLKNKKYKIDKENTVSNLNIKIVP